MAESLLFSFAESVLGKLATAAVQEASLALGVHSELQQMKENMAIIKGVLLDAEKKTTQSSGLSQWLRQVKRVFSDAEDIVDDFECETLRKHVVNTYGSFSRKLEMTGCPELWKKFKPEVGSDWDKISFIKDVYNNEEEEEDEEDEEEEDEEEDEEDEDSAKDGKEDDEEEYSHNNTIKS
ncbi:probable ATP-dependent RNA helicase ddx56 [Vigna radiata var. radiata]|uniref:Probable ATP-dependent RNA helicase ddx56 n=1 Tax=Vigna radiata var. radiata TaxID=3916 RepID=A0A3Q0FCF7_VIGRR|nr:probable ATP-dependent RNA helicase ddx56 [Vigna radiata var. radiata]